MCEPHAGEDRMNITVKATNMRNRLIEEWLEYQRNNDYSVSTSKNWRRMSTI